jgi:hypothetical protein
MPRKSAYDRWLKFIGKPTSESGLTFPTDEAQAIMALSPRPVDWRRDKREINKAAKRARAADVPSP